MFFSPGKEVSQDNSSFKAEGSFRCFSANLLLSPNIFSLSLLLLFLLLVFSFSSPLFFLLSMWNYAGLLHFGTSSHVEHRPALDPVITITNFSAILVFALLLVSCSVESDPLQPHRLQHTRPPCPSLSLGACSNSCPLSR